MKIKLRKFNAEDAYLLKKYQFHQMDMNEITDMIALWNKNLYNGRYCEVFAAEYEGALSGWFSMAELPNGGISIGPTVFEPYRQKGIAFSVMEICCSLQKETDIPLQKRKSESTTPQA